MLYKTIPRVLATVLLTVNSGFDGPNQQSVQGELLSLQTFEK